MAEKQSLDKVEKREVETPREKTKPSKFFVPDTDIFENEQSLFVVMEVPGVERKDIVINVEKDILSVEGRIDFTKYEGLKPLYTEYNVGHFSRSFSLSSEIDQGGISAKIEDGVLTLILPKAKEAQPRRIEVV